MKSYYRACGHIINDDWIFCHDCGTPTGNNTERDNENDYFNEP